MLGQIASPVTVNVTTSAQGSRSGSQRSLPAVSRLWHHAQSHAKVSGRQVCHAQSQSQAGPAAAQRKEPTADELTFQSQDDLSTDAAVHHELQGHSIPSQGLQRGDKIAGRYEVLSVNSHKGSTTFYTARAQGGRKVAVKALSLQNMAKWDELEAFERESRALRALTHARSANTAIPSFVEVFEEDDHDRTFYLVQELVEGPTMAQRLAQGWRASPSTLQRLTTQLTQALQDLSQATGGPIAHGAITTDNIILRQTPEGLQACLTNFSFAEQLLRDSDPSPPAATPSAPIQQTTADRMASHAAASSSSGSWDVEVEVASEPDMSAVHARSSSSSAAADAEVVMGGLSEALATEVGFAAPEALAGEPRMGVSDAYSVGAVLAAAAAGSSGTEQAAAGRGVPPSGLQGTRLAAVMQGLLQPDWQRRLTADQALRVLAGQPMPAMPAPQAPRLAGTGFQGLAQQVMQMGRNARSSLQAGPGRSRQQASVPAAEGRRSQPQGNGLPAAVLGLAAATLFLGPGLPMFLFSILPFLAAGSSPPRYALAGSPCPPRPSMGFQNAPGRYVSPMQQQQMLRMMLAQQAQQQRLQSARSMQLLSSRQLQQRQRGQQMWGGFF